MKKTFDSFKPCLELREVIFLRTLPTHAHLVPALDIFLDPFSKKLHICMEFMDGNLYQLMKARDHKCMDAKSVKSILYQILSGLDHIHSHHFFHRDIKPENILVSTSAPHDSHTGFSRYSAMVTPPSTPPTYTIKIADFGLARETHSKLPYTTYVSTRWYRAPEVLLRAGEYSAPVDIWAIGAMAVEIATLKPLFPGGNEVDQVWRVCEIMGSPGNWYTKNGVRVGGGEWRDGTRLAQKLGFSFPKMAPHAIETILQPPHWPASLSHFVGWCLMWDPKNRPTSRQAMEHEFFADASNADSDLKPRLRANKRATWAQGSSVAPMPILPSIRPISPLPNAVNALADPSPAANKDLQHPSASTNAKSRKISRQLSVNSNSNGNHDAENHRLEAERALNANSGLVSPPQQRESFFSHLRKRARRFSGRHGLTSPGGDDIEANAANVPWSNRSSMMVDSIIPEAQNDFADLDQMLQSVRYSLDHGDPTATHPPAHNRSNQSTLKRSHSGPRSQESQSNDKAGALAAPQPGRNLRRPIQLNQYEAPAEEDELLDEALRSANRAARRLGPVQKAAELSALGQKDGNGPPLVSNNASAQSEYMTPSPSAKRNGVQFHLPANASLPVDIRKRAECEYVPPSWPTPPYEENEWASAAAASIFAASSVYR
ncbi:hypothetical protein DV737_g2005, partial [Chaetothyriales sp. CBS 132003]